MVHEILIFCSSYQLLNNKLPLVIVNYDTKNVAINIPKRDSEILSESILNANIAIRNKAKAVSRF